MSNFENPNLFLDSIHPEDYNKVVNAFNGFTQKNIHFNIRYRRLTENGEIKWVNIKLHYLDDNEGEEIKIPGSTEDVTEREKVKIALKESEDQFRTIWNVSLDGMRIMDEYGKIILVNDAFCRMVGLSRDQLEGAHLSVLFHKSIDEISDPMEQNSKMEIYKQRFFEKTIEPKFERELHLWDDRKVWFEVTNAYMEIDGSKNVLLSVFRDITERKNYSEKLARERNLLNTLIQNLPDSIYVKDKEGRKTLTNPTDLKFIGKEESEVIGKTDLESFPDEIALKCFSDDMSVIRTGLPILNREELIENSEGRKFWLLTSKLPLKDSEGNTYGLMGIGHDITERKRAEQIIKMQNKQLQELNANKDKFFSIIAHDLKSPFHGFLNLTKIMATESKSYSVSEFTSFSQALNDSAVNLYKLLENLLEWAVMQQGKTDFNLQKLNLNTMVSKNITTITDRAKQKGISLINQVKDSINVSADEKMIDTVLRNLLSNAVKFTRKDGIINVNAIPIENGMIEISVRDTGIGISKNDVDRLFRVGEKVSSKGTDNELSTGLGLLLCKEFVEKHGGKIWVESEKENLPAHKTGGSTFYFTLPENKVSP